MADRGPSRKAAIGRSLPIFTTACAGQIESKRLVSTDANGWSVAMQMSGQVHAITQRVNGMCNRIFFFQFIPCFLINLFLSLS